MARPADTVKADVTGETRVRLRLSSVLLAVSGILLVGVGIYFLFLRPPLLPEDIR